MTDRDNKDISSSNCREDNVEETGAGAGTTAIPDKESKEEASNKRVKKFKGQILITIRKRGFTI